MLTTNFPFCLLQTGDLTITDREYLNLLLTSMRHVEQDEILYPGAQSTGFLQDFRDIVELLEILIEKEDRWVSFEMFCIFDICLFLNIFLFRLIDIIYNSTDTSNSKQ